MRRAIRLDADVARRADRDVEPAVLAERDRSATRGPMASRSAESAELLGRARRLAVRPIARAHCRRGGDVEIAVLESEAVRVGQPGEQHLGFGAAVVVAVRQRDDLVGAPPRDEQHALGLTAIIRAPGRSEANTETLKPAGTFRSSSGATAGAAGAAGACARPTDETEISARLAPTAAIPSPRTTEHFS